jgi:hypothetical protein
MSTVSCDNTIQLRILQPQDSRNILKVSSMPATTRRYLFLLDNYLTNILPKTRYTCSNDETAKS